MIMAHIEPGSLIKCYRKSSVAFRGSRVVWQKATMLQGRLWTRHNPPQCKRQRHSKNGKTLDFRGAIGLSVCGCLDGEMWWRNVTSNRPQSRETKDVAFTEFGSLPGKRMRLQLDQLEKACVQIPAENAPQRMQLARDYVCQKPEAKEQSRETVCTWHVCRWIETGTAEHCSFRHKA